jgi:hypothetical protein
MQLIAGSLVLVYVHILKHTGGLRVLNLLQTNDNETVPRQTHNVLIFGKLSTVNANDTGQQSISGFNKQH